MGAAASFDRTKVKLLFYNKTETLLTEIRKFYPDIVTMPETVMLYDMKWIFINLNICVVYSWKNVIRKHCPAMYYRTYLTDWYYWKQADDDGIEEKMFLFPYRQMLFPEQNPVITYIPCYSIGPIETMINPLILNI
jgi:hypothetical protein